MKNYKFLLTLFSCFFIVSSIFSQRGKDGDYTVSTDNEIVNAYTFVTGPANIAVGATSINVDDNQLNSGYFTNNLQAGDLVLIIQMQGTDILFSNYAIDNWGADFSLPNDYTWGSIYLYNNTGNHELAEVESVSGGNTISFQCGLKNAYTTSGRVQVIRVPRFNSLTVDNSITAPTWNGQVGGIVALEVLGDVTLNNSGSIQVTGLGFRGGELNDDASLTAGSESQGGHFASINPITGGEKGEGIGGNRNDLIAINGLYGRAAAANAGGGGNYHNSGGGGGANAGIGRYNSLGNPAPGFDAAWDLELPNFSDSVSSGGGKGGYSHCNTNLNALVDGPNNAGWGAPDYRRSVGGRGGRPLDYSTGKLFFGGGGGAGEQNNGDAGPGGNGGGLVYVSCYGQMTGLGTIEANGANGGDSGDGTGSGGGDGAGGAGGGGTVYINAKDGVSNSIGVNAQGGTGGNQLLAQGIFADKQMNGPGGGGGGGYISVSSGAPTRTVDGGNAGTSNSTYISEFPMNGATAGGAGIGNASVPHYSIEIDDTLVCGGGDVLLEIDVIGTLPVGTTIGWYTQQFGGAAFHTGTSYNATGVVANTTYYVGLCPGNYRIPVTITTSPAINIDETGLAISDVTCTGGDGSISGISASGGFGTLDFTWNGTASATEDISNLNAGTYTLTVEDENGCQATSGPHTVGSSGAPVLDTIPHVITDQTCDGGDGSITGITVSGGTGALTFEWNGNPSATLDITNLTAGDYTLVVEDALGCQATSGVYTISTTADPQIDDASIVITDANCGLTDGEISGLAVTGNGGYTYQWDGNASPSIDISSLAPGNHELIVTDMNNCDDTLIVALGELSGPQLDISSMSVIETACDTDNGSINGVSASGNGPFTYEWNGVNVGNNSTLTGLGVSSNTVVVFDAGGCSDTLENINVSMQTGPMIDVTGLNVQNTECTSNTGEITGITAAGNGPFTYEWNGTNQGANADLTGLGVSTNELVVFDSNGCSDTLSNIPIVTDAGPTIDATNINLTDENCSQCDGSISGIQIVGGSAPYTYAWSNTTQTDLDLSNLCANTYDLTVTDDAGCEAILTGNVIDNVGQVSINDNNLSVQNETCLENDGSITGLVGSGGTGTLNYQWSPIGGVNADAAGLAQGDYTLTVTDNVGCSQVYGPVTVGLDPGLEADFSFAPTEPIVDEQITFTDLTTNNPISWDWDFGNGNTDSEQNPITSFDEAGTYIVTLIASDGNCNDTVSKQVIVLGNLQVPNVITPNGDGVNDTFFIKGLQSNTELEIRNRWGNVVYRTTNYDNLWDGTDAKGNKVTPGTYFYIIQKNSELLKQGFFEVRIDK